MMSLEVAHVTFELIALTAEAPLRAEPHSSQHFDVLYFSLLLFNFPWQLIQLSTKLGG